MWAPLRNAAVWIMIPRPFGAKGDGVDALADQVELACPRCGTSNRAQARFCKACGSAVEGPDLRLVPSGEVRFCESCGQRLAEVPPLTPGTPVGVEPQEPSLPQQAQLKAPAEANAAIPSISMGSSVGAPAHRQCPHCNGAMRRDESVCPHCRGESRAWVYWEGRWWAKDSRGQSFWYDELASAWKTPADSPPVPADGFEVVVLSLGTQDASVAKQDIARMVASGAGKSLPEIARRLETLPAVVLEGIPEETAEVARSAISRQGAEIEVRPRTVQSLTPPPALEGGAGIIGSSPG